MSDSEFVNRLLKRKLLLPPLAGYTDRPYRSVLAEFNPPFICTEMISPFAIIHKNPQIFKMLEKVNGSHLSGVQLIGSDKVAMGEAAKIIEQLGYNYIDINMGCAVKTVIDSGGGVALMKNEEKAHEIASAITSAVEIPVTCKLRLGATNNARNAVSLARRLQNAGVAAITIHGRTGEKKFGLKVEPDGIREVVEAVEIPIIANGGVFTGGDAAEMLNLTGATAVMPGRGIIGNPWIIPEIESTVSALHYEPPTLSERRKVCLNHLNHMIEHYGEMRGVISMRRILPRYFTKCIHSSALKRDNQRATSIGEIIELLEHIQENGSRISYHDTG
ncbi:MAG: tRNA-dihydrouridine synthase [Candidatus Bathyarchaeota archaeon]|nr:tRNA-dihydrouridine synthase [Candidatus Bathyarchaeota archaeon]